MIAATLEWMMLLWLRAMGSALPLPEGAAVGCEFTGPGNSGSCGG